MAENSENSGIPPGELPDDTQFMPRPFLTMGRGAATDPEEIKAVQRFLLRVGGPTIAMKLMPGGADGKYDARMAEAVGTFQDRFVSEPHVRGTLDIATSRAMTELRSELATQDRSPDALAHIISQIPDDPRHPLETGEGPHAMLRSAQYHALDATRHDQPKKPGPEETRFIQEILQARGYNLGPAGIDGKPGKYFDAALRDYQRDAGLEPIGVLKNGGLDPATHELMKLDDDRLQQRKLESELRLMTDRAPGAAKPGSIDLSNLLDVAPPAAGPESTIATVDLGDGMDTPASESPAAEAPNPDAPAGDPAITTYTGNHIGVSSHAGGAHKQDSHGFKMPDIKINIGGGHRPTSIRLKLW